MKNLNKSVIIIPTILVLIIGILITIFPNTATVIISSIKNFLCNELGIYYLIFGLAIFLLIIGISFSKIGKIRIGKKEDKPMNIVTWGILIFTSTMAADILFYSFHEWTNYWNGEMLNQHIDTIENKLLWSSTYSLFHWGFIPWSFYLILAAIYAFMFFNKHRRNKQNMAEMCRPILKDRTDGKTGKLINIISVFGLLCGTSTTFSITTPFMSAIVCKIFHLQNSVIISIILLIIIAIIYGIAVMTKHGINTVAKLTIIIFSFLLALFLIVGNPKFIFENGLQGLGNMFQNFFRMSTWTEPTRATNFVQDWTIYFWAYWIAWSVATPFFIAKISKGRTIKQILLGGGLCGLLGTFSSFIIFGGFGMHLQATSAFDIISLLQQGMTPAQAIVEMISTLKFSSIIMLIILLAMFGLYASTFDALTDVVSSFSYKELDIDKNPSKKVKLYWVIIFLILPIALLFLDTTNQLLMSMAIIGAFPLTIIIILIIISFFKEVKNYEQKD